MATQSDVSPPPSLEDELMAVTLDADDHPDTAPADDSPEASPLGESDAPADDQVDQADQLEEVDADGDDPAALDPATPAEAVTDSAAWQPPAGGESFAFRADGREVPVPGALKYPHGIYVPNEAWTTVQRHLADREAFNGQLRHKDQQIAALDPDRHPDVIKGRESVKAMAALLDKGPEEVAKWLDNYAINRPLIDAQIEKATLEARLQSYTQQQTTAQTEQAAKDLAERLPVQLRQTMDAVIQSTPEFAELASMGEKLFEKLWPFAEHLFLELDRDVPEYNLRKGQVIVRQDVLRQLLTPHAEARAEVKRLEVATKQNQAATRKTPVPPTVTSRGRPVPGTRPKTYAPGDRSWKDDLLNDPLED